MADFAKGHSSFGTCDNKQNLKWFYEKIPKKYFKIALERGCVLLAIKVGKVIARGKSRIQPPTPF